MHLKTEVCGFYKLTAVKIIDGKEIKRPLTGWFPNIITNGGLDDMVPRTYYIYNCVVGTGATAPAATDTALVNRVAVTDNVISNTDSINSTTPYYGSYIKTFRFGEGVAAGNLSEVGITNSYDTTLFSRALILDTFGAPTTITVLSDEYLDVTYEFRYYPYETDVTGNITFTGNIGGTYAYTLRPADITTLVQHFGLASAYYPANLDNRRSHYYSAGAIVRAYAGGALGLITGSPTGTLIGDLTYINLSVSYVNGSYVNYITIQANPTDWNDASGIKTIAFHWGMNLYQIEFTPAIPKTATDVLSLTFSHTFNRK